MKIKTRTISIAITIALAAFSIIGQVKPEIKMRNVNFCELKSNPDKFAEKIIQSTSIYIASLETA